MSKKIDKMFYWYKKKLSKKRDMKYEEILSMIPTGTYDSMYEFLKLDNVYLNKRTKWIYFLARVNIVIFLLNNYKSKNEKQYHNDIEIDLRYMIRGDYLKTKNKEIDQLLDDKIVELNINLNV